MSKIANLGDERPLQHRLRGGPAGGRGPIGAVSGEGRWDSRG